MANVTSFALGPVTSIAGSLPVEDTPPGWLTNYGRGEVIRTLDPLLPKQSERGKSLKSNDTESTDDTKDHGVAPRGVDSPGVTVLRKLGGVALSQLIDRSADAGGSGARKAA